MGLLNIDKDLASGISGINMEKVPSICGTFCLIIDSFSASFENTSTSVCIASDIPLL